MKIEDINTYLNSLNNHEIEKKLLGENETIIEQGTEAGYIYYLVKGMVKAFHVNEFANEFLFGIFGNDEFFGELEFFTSIKYYNYVETITDCELIKIPHNVFEELLKSNHMLFMAVSKSLAVRLVEISKRTVEYSYFPVEYLLSKFLYHEAVNKNNKIIVLSKEDTANYLGTNIRTINRVLKKFSEKKLLKINKNEIHVNNLKGLGEIFKSFNK